MDEKPMSIIEVGLCRFFQGGHAHLSSVPFSNDTPIPLWFTVSLRPLLAK
jgi:hypothetical protein